MDSHRDSMDSISSSKLESTASSSYKSSDALLESGEALDRRLWTSKFRFCHVCPRPFLMGWIFATAIHICIVLLALTFTNFMRLNPSDRTCSAKLSTYSPMLKAVKYEKITYQNDFHQPSIYRGYPTHEREKAWEALWNHKTMNVPEDKVQLLNYTPTAEYMHTPAKYGHGLEALVEVFHQLHCLGLIRQYIYLDSYEVRPHPFDVNDSVIHEHVDHCIETVRMALMCAGDVTPLPIRNDPQGIVGAKADFSTMRKCRNWDSLVKWISENGVNP